ncbi:uncharacterized protein PRCAT00004908001 [Priceomyces carsonii]|uniref:uncharacterized protein n=1 Tax=Priceomyces carsonii TaxID=28549 RepID=UPI002EDAC34D|nr:unnamed protein product [Priceomyces carsonii]
MVNLVLKYTITPNQSEVVPPLEDIVENTFQIGDYTRENFKQFLSSIHCIENLEFVTEVNQYLKADISEYETLWERIYNTFLREDSEKEINITHTMRQTFSIDKLPYMEDLQRAKLLINDILLDSYYEYVRSVKMSQALRRQSEPIPPERSITPDCHLKLHDIGTPSSSTSESTDVFDQEDTDMVSASKGRTNSTGSSRGSSIGSIVDSLKHNDYIPWKRTVRKFRIRRFSNDGP